MRSNGSSAIALRSDDENLEQSTDEGQGGCRRTGDADDLVVVAGP